MHSQPATEWIQSLWAHSWNLVKIPLSWLDIGDIFSGPFTNIYIINIYIYIEPKLSNYVINYVITAMFLMGHVSSKPSFTLKH